MCSNLSGFGTELDGLGTSLDSVKSLQGRSETDGKPVTALDASIGPSVIGAQTLLTLTLTLTLTLNQTLTTLTLTI